MALNVLVSHRSYADFFSQIPSNVSGLIRLWADLTSDIDGIVVSQDSC